MTTPRFSVAFDFDSTLVGIETLEELIHLSLQERLSTAEVAQALKEISAITDAGMNGEIDLSESIARRLAKARIRREHIDQLSERLMQSVTPGIEDVLSDLRQHSCPIFIVSGAFDICVHPVTDMLGIPRDHVFTAKAVFDTHGILTGVEGILSKSNGKTQCLRMLREKGLLPGEVVMVGDGISDLIPFKDGAAEHFCGFGIHRRRPAVEKEAPHYFLSIEDLHRHIRSLLSP